MSGSESRFPKSLIEFQGRFATESACAEYLFERCWPEGFVCPGCGGGRALVLQTKTFSSECARSRPRASGDARAITHAPSRPSPLGSLCRVFMLTTPPAY